VSDGLTPQAFIGEVASHVLLARVLGIVAELGIADLVAARSRSMDELVEATGADRESLYRVLRMLAGHGIFAEDEAGRIGLTPRAEVLRSDHSESVRDLLRLDWQDIQWATYGELPAAIRSGEIAFERAYGQGFFEYLAQHPDLNSVFDRRMASVSKAENTKIVAAYPFDEFSRVMDIGGGKGGLLAAILTRYASVVGVLFEQPQVLSDPAELAEARLLDRCELIAGDFFDEVPGGCDLYLLKRIIHDWDDQRAARVLKRCRDAMVGGGMRKSRIAVIDAVMRPGNEPDPNKIMDLSIMALTPGKERTEAEFKALFREAGLRVTRIIQTGAPSTLSIVEGSPAD